MIEEIKYKDNLLAIIMGADYKEDGISFFTPSYFSQQLGYMKREKDYEIDPHVHNPVKREVMWTQEVLFIKSGRVRVDFYNDEKEYLESRVIKKGDVILLAAGGHGFKMLEESEIIEVKQGPYSGDRDKTRFDPVQSKNITIK
ncbi:hypothetical protein C5O00_09650 [Pukyongia salina]|uniref:Uncharacterized protein n=1 Tax=Pukyongia salina TaxID=2094025 RepID=A0A2S0HXL4_9FLAO|nr:hypothetical protein [Pukyongia salina]AVI51421.1 hypothetical protein C5O00_09650 [Pukyongia salina]